MSAELPDDIVGVDAALRLASRTFAYPPTPNIAAGVSARLRETSRRRALPDFGSLLAQPAARFAAAAAAAAVIALGAALAVPTSRGALADFFGLSHVKVSVGPAEGPTPPVLAPESFARPSSLIDAQTAVEFPLRFPAQDGDRLQPDAVYIQGETWDMPIIIFVYEDYDLYQTQLGYFGKGLPANSFEEISFAGLDALWIYQGGHIAEFLDAQGRTVVESRRSVDRATLLWEENGITYRLETSLDQQAAIAVAESLGGT